VTIGGLSQEEGQSHRLQSQQTRPESSPLQRLHGAPPAPQPMRQRLSALVMALGCGLLAWVAHAPAHASATTRATPQASAPAKAPQRAQPQRPQAQPTAAQRQQAQRHQQAQRQQAQRPQAQRPAQSQAQRQQAQRQAAARSAAAARPSFGQLAGLRETVDALDLNSSVALVIDQETNEVLFSKNADAVLPIASITKLMTALVIVEKDLPLDQGFVVTPEDARVLAGSTRRLLAGTRITRGQMLHLALMSSENRAAHMLGRTYPGGMPAFVLAMNDMARELGMNDSRFVEPTGLSAENQSTGHDLALLVRAAAEHDLIRELSTATGTTLPVGRQRVEFRTTNGLVHNPAWDIGLQKTGYIAAAGRCVAMQTEVAGRKTIMVLLDSAGRVARVGDAERLRRWISDSAAGLAGEAVTQLR
jgi:serine-type D-Ala-D-Ala endopeptidase (penicillin-binding protein 7)